MLTRSSRVVLGLFAVVFGASCATAAQPRTARVAEPGGIAGELYLPVTTVGSGVAKGAVDLEPVIVADETGP